MSRSGDNKKIKRQKYHAWLRRRWEIRNQAAAERRQRIVNEQQGRVER